MKTILLNRMNPLVLLVLGLALNCVGGWGRAVAQDLAGPFAFTSATQYSSNFATTLTNNGTLAVSGGVLSHTATSAGSTAMWVYDTVPDSTPTTTTWSSFCVTTTFIPTGSGDSFGFLFYNGSFRTGDAILSMFNVNSSGTDDIIRFFSGAAMNSSSVGTQLGTTRTLSGGGFTTGRSCSATLVVSPISSSGAVATLILADPSGTAPDFIATQYLTGLGAVTGEIGFRSYKGAAGSNSFDNLAVRVPMKLSILEGNITSATISWSSVSGAVKYRVYRDGVLLATTTGLSYSDSGSLNYLKSYEYQVIALDSGGLVRTASPVTVYAYRRFAFVPSWDDASTGTVADMSDWTTLPASQRVTVSNGRFMAGGQRIKFLGVNLVTSACFPSRTDAVLGNVAEKIAARLEKMGVNCVRLHGIDRPTPAGVLSTSPSDRSTLDASQMDKLDYFISRLKAHGIYVDINLHVYFSSADDYLGLLPGIDNYDPTMIQLQKDFASALLTHTNAYTGNTYANEPSVAFLEISNEDGLINLWRNGGLDAGTTVSSTYLNELKSQWNTWLQGKYVNTASLSAAWAASSGQSYGTSLVDNGDFASGFVSPWILQVQSADSSPAAATYSLVTGGAPDGGSAALKVNVTTAAPTQGWRVALFYAPVSTTSVEAIQYTATFWAKADSSRTVRVGFMQHHSPWSMLTSDYVTLTTDWRQYTLVIPQSVADTSVRFIVTDLAKQTGNIWFSNFSVVSGNTLLGPGSASAEGALGSEMLANGTFSGTLPPWSLQVSSPAAGSAQIISGGATDGSNALKIDTTVSSSDAWRVQLLQAGQSYTVNQPYTVTFRAKATSARTISALLMQAHSPYSNLAVGSVMLTTNWQPYTLVLLPNASDGVARFTLSGMASTTGSVWLSNVSVKPGTPGIGLPGGESLGTSSMLQPSRWLGRTRAAQQDWLTFLWQTEKNYWTSMRSHIRTTLNAQGLVMGSQNGFSPALIQSEMDVVNDHAYWQHPVFPSGWDNNNWHISNVSMAGDSTGGAFGKIAVARVPGKPFLCTEYNAPAPNTHGGEAFLIAASYAAMQDWDGIFLHAYLDGGSSPTLQYCSQWFQGAQEPAKTLTFPVAASILRQGTVTAATNSAIATVALDQAIAMTGRASLSATSFGISNLTAMKWPTGLQTGTYSQISVPYMPSSTTEILSPTNELTWYTTDKTVTVNADKVKMLVGQTNSLSFDFGDGVVITPGTSMQSGNWCAISLMAKDGVNFQSAGKILITATGYTDNHKMAWKSGMGPLDAASSVGTNWGQLPSLIEGINATVVLPAATAKVSVWALDACGQHRASVPVTDASGKASFTLSRSYLTGWYEVIIAP